MHDLEYGLFSVFVLANFHRDREEIFLKDDFFVAMENEIDIHLE